MDYKKELKKKLGESYERLMKQWMASAPAQLVEAAEEIAAARFIHNSLEEAITEGDARFLLQYDDPLIAMREQWLKEHGSQLMHDKDLIHCVSSLSAAQMNTGEPVTVQEFLARHPGDSFQIMSPGGYVCLDPEQAEALLAGGDASAHPGEPAYAMRVTADELLPQLVGGAKLERGVWFMGTYAPEMTQEMTMQ